MWIVKGMYAVRVGLTLKGLSITACCLEIGMHYYSIGALWEVLWKIRSLVCHSRIVIPTQRLAMNLGLA